MRSSPTDKTRARSVWARVLVRWVAVLVAVLFGFQTAGVELVVSHEATSHQADVSGIDAAHPVASAGDHGACSDHAGDACDCGPNCHCCFACAHHATPALAGDGLAWLAMRQVVSAEAEATPLTSHVSTIDAAPPPKVPKPLA